jgi:hypothetical protein
MPCGSRRFARQRRHAQVVGQRERIRSADVEPARPGDGNAHGGFAAARWSDDDGRFIVQCYTEYVEVNSVFG